MYKQVETRYVLKVRGAARFKSLDGWSSSLFEAATWDDQMVAENARSNMEYPDDLEVVQVKVAIDVVEPESNDDDEATQGMFLAGYGFHLRPWRR